MRGDLIILSFRVLDDKNMLCLNKVGNVALPVKTAHDEASSRSATVLA